MSVASGYVLPFQHFNVKNLAMAKFDRSRRVVPIPWDTRRELQIQKSLVPVHAPRTPESNSNTISQRLVVHVVAGSNPAQIDDMLSLFFFTALLLIH